MTELIWEGKYNREGKKNAPVRIALPFQTIETVNESAQDRLRTLDLFAQGRPTEWRNRLIWGDKKYVLPSLLPEFAGKINLIYIDPPFDTGADFSFTATIPDNPETEDDETMTFHKQPSMIEQKAYRDTWGRGIESYIQWFYESVILLRELLSEEGSLYVHLDYHVSHYAKAILDEVFGYDKFLNEIVWKRQTAKSDVTQGSRHMGRIHETIFMYTKSESYIWNMQYTEYDQSYVEAFYRYKDPDGRLYQLSDITAPGKATKGNPYYEFLGVTRYWRFSRERMQELYNQGRIVQTAPGRVPRQKRYLDEMPGVPLQDLWLDIQPVQSQSKEIVEYATQKPEKLLERIIKLSSNEGDLVLDCFCGSGTTASVAEKLNRRWIACDLGRFAIHTTRKRLLEIPGVKPFVVQNLGKYERQQWMGAEFEKAQNRAALEQQYRHFILQLYHAEPISGYTYLHGVKAGRMIYVGSVEAPVANGDVKNIVQEFWKSVGKPLPSPTSVEMLVREDASKGMRVNGIDILGWDFAFELNETARQFAAANKVDLKFKKIPREVLEKKAVEQGDIRFFELASLTVDVTVEDKLLNIALADFIVPPDDVPEEVRRSITHWSQWIDYWAVDWDYKDDTFHNEWQSYRIKKDPAIELKTRRKYKEEGKYNVVIKVIDILGNDTTKMLEIEVK
ncbi:MAG: site-specific DNA-methyltransferase [Candidatus Brocadia sp. WS118]|nr:MAG: site-specific DNA-methyltransferase [Candidatus Brocadia sp. WS118]